MARLVSPLHLESRSERHRASERGGHPRRRTVPVTGLSKKVYLVVGLTLFAGATPLFPQDDQIHRVLDTLVVTYPDALAGHDGKALRWRDGTVMPVSDDN